MKLFNRELTIEQVVGFVQSQSKHPNCSACTTDNCLIFEAALELSKEVQRLTEDLSRYTDAEHCKTVRVTNPRNVLVQIPSYVIAQWHPESLNYLQVNYNEQTNEVRIKPAV